MGVEVYGRQVGNGQGLTKRLDVLRYAFALLVALVALGCGGEPEPEPVRSLAEALTNPTGPARPSVQPIKFMPFGLTTKECVGVLVSERWVLTAAHCFTRPAEFGGPIDPANVTAVLAAGGMQASPSDVHSTR